MRNGRGYGPPPWGVTLTWRPPTTGGTVKGYRILRQSINNSCCISPDPTRHDRTGYIFGDNNFGRATAQ